MRISGEPVARDEGGGSKMTSGRALAHDFGGGGGGSEWTRLAAEIDDLERLCRSNNRHHPHSRQPPCLAYNYHRRSTPQMQRATSVWIEPANDPPLPRSHPVEESCRWSWRPRTEFERSYFLDDYADRRYDEFSVGKNDRLPSSRPDSTETYNNNNNKKSTKNGGTIHEQPSSYSGTRERLHEIFERNRYLRRKFFMGQGEVEGRSGYGSSETIGSNRSVSSDGRSREGGDETRSRRRRRRRKDYEDDDDDDDGSMNVTRVEGGGILATSKNGKLLVNVVDNFRKDDGWTNSGKINGEVERISLDGSGVVDIYSTGETHENNWFENNSTKLPADQSQNHCKSLPNLQICKNGEPKNSRPFAENIGETSYDKNKFCLLFSSQTDLSNSDSNSFTLRRLKVSKLPPPLDLSRVNEKFEEQLERETDTVRVSLIRNYNCPMEGRPTVVRDECSSDENRDGSIERSSLNPNGSVETAPIVERNDQKYDSSLINRSRDRDESLDGDPSCESSGRVSENVGKDKGEEANSNLDKRRVEISSKNDTCGRDVGNSIEEKEKEEEESWNKFLTAYLTTMDELQSPQLVNNCKNSMMDGERRETFHERRRRPSMSNHANSMNGGQAGNGSTLPSVYGPIPYSQ